jgi:S-adenosylmethionine-diacylgycerolhomoserine-N-methlytransferase
MAPSTSLASPPPDAARWGLTDLERFYRVHAVVYDWTRPFFLYGRKRLLCGLGVRRGDLALDVGCGTGWGLPALARLGADVIGIECSAVMRRRADARIVRRALVDRVRVDPRPYGSHDGYRRAVDILVFSYSLTMIPPYLHVLDAARDDLAAGGRIGVVDFLDARPPFDRWLAASHVQLGPARLDALKQRFPVHVCETRSAGMWRYFLFWGESERRVPRAAPIGPPSSSADEGSIDAWAGGRAGGA